MSCERIHAPQWATNAGAESQRARLIAYSKQQVLLFVATAAAMPAMAQAPSWVGPAGSEAHRAAPIPDFSRVWNHPAFPWFEPPASGPGPTN